MKLKKYFVSYHYRNKGDTGQGCIILDIKKFDLTEITEFIIKEMKFEKVVIMFFKEIKWKKT